MISRKIKRNVFDGNSSAAGHVTATLAGSDRCEADGIAIRGAAPVLKLCRSLIAAGLDPDRALHVFRGAKLALRIRSLRDGARLTVKEPDRGRVHFAPWHGLPSSPGAAAARNSGSAPRAAWGDWPAATDGAAP